MEYNILGIKLIQTCGVCPEQYDAFIGPVQVGYLRLRHRFFYVDYPDYGGKTIYTANPKGDGVFTYEEREHYLTKACEAIWDEHMREE